MPILFIKVFIISACLLAFILILFKGFLSSHSLWKVLMQRSYLKDFFSGGLYAKPVILKAIKHYVPPWYQISAGRYSGTQKSLTQFVTRFAEQNSTSRHMLILADPGMGKTTFALNFYLASRNSRKKQFSVLLIPLGIKDADSRIRRAPDKKNTVLFLDGLDEESQAFQNTGDRLLQLMEMTARFKKVIITSSPGFIPDKQIKALKEGYKVESGSGMGTRRHKFRVVYMSPITYSQAQKMLNSRLPFWKNSLKKRTLEYIKANSSGITSFTLTYMPDILPEEPVLLSRNFVYEKIVQYWVANQHAWNDKKLLADFIEQLAVNLYVNRLERGEEAIKANELTEWFQKAWERDLNVFEKGEKSLLSRDYAGKVRFAHRSIMEYLFVQQLIKGNKACFQHYLTSEMKNFFLGIFEEKTSDLLQEELQWLKKLQFKVQGASAGSTAKNSSSDASVFKTILNKNSQYRFLEFLTGLLDNPIFKEFGWDPKLYKNLKLAMQESKSSFMELKATHQNVLVTSDTIEISQKGRPTKKIRLTGSIMEEYSGMLNNAAAIKLNRAVGIDGLHKMASLNRSREIAILPDLKSFDSFTLVYVVS